MRFADRTDAGRQLAQRLLPVRLRSPVVLGLPRGGIPVAVEVAAALGAPLEVFVARKIGAPGHEELGIGAVAEGLDEPVVSDTARLLGVNQDDLDRLALRARLELERRVSRYRAGRPLPVLSARDVVLVDDGLATGVTAEAALRALRRRAPGRLILAVPVCAQQTAARLTTVADRVVHVAAPADLRAVGDWYDDFRQTSDEEVLRLLSAGSRMGTEPAEIAVGDAVLQADLVMPRDADAIVVFAHGSGSGRHSPRNRRVAERLWRDGLGALLLDLLTESEEAADVRTRQWRFDIDLLAARLAGAAEWLNQEAAPSPRVGYFGASTGAAAALVAAGRQGDRVGAIVSRGGRPDLAGSELSRVRAPTLLIVGGKDDTVLALNRQAQAVMQCDSRVEVIPGATHLFEEPGALDEVARLASDWFRSHLWAAGREEDRGR